MKGKFNNIKRLPPLKAIRMNCLECQGGSAGMVRNCPTTVCELHPYRFGKRPEGMDHRPLGAIRRFCLDCNGGHNAEIKSCSGPCFLHEYRMGKNPARKGQGNPKNLPLNKPNRPQNGQLLLFGGTG